MRAGSAGSARRSTTCSPATSSAAALISSSCCLQREPATSARSRTTSSRRSRRGIPRRSRSRCALDEADSVQAQQSIHSDLVSLAILGGDIPTGAHHANEALRLAEELDDAERIADALSSVARTEQLLGRGLRRDLLERADALAGVRRTDSLEETVNVVRNTNNWASVLA